LKSSCLKLYFIRYTLLAHRKEPALRKSYIAVLVQL
jgi:hypothetical protein